MAVVIVKNTLDLDKNGALQPGSLRAAVRKAKSGDTIRFSRTLTNKNIKLSRILSIDKNLILDGRNAPGLAIDGQKKTVIFSLTGKRRSFTMRNLIVKNAFHISNGAAIRAKDANAKIVVENSEFRNNTAGYGAAIWAKTNGAVTVANSKFYNNRATIPDDTAAGAITVFDKSKLRVKGSEFIGNQGFAGGAISTIFTEITVADSVFKRNKSVRYSGALHADGASIPAQERYYIGSKQRDRVGKSIIISNNLFENNRSGGRGGGVGVWGYDQDFVTLTGNDFIRNTVTKNSDGIARGGGLRVSGKKVTIKDSRFIGNQSASEGGGLWYQGESTTNISNTLFEKNRAATKGGAIYNRQWNGPGTSISNSTFKKNTAPKGGSAIYKHRPRRLDISRSLFQSNGPKEIAGELGNLITRTPGRGFVPINRKQASSLKASLVATTAEATVPKTTLSNTSSAVVASVNFDEGRGKTASDNADAYGRNNVSFQNGVTWTQGIGGTAAAFDGQTTTAKIASSKGINLDKHQQRTVSFWFNADSIQRGEKKQVLYKEGGAARGLNVYLDDDLLYVGGWNRPKSESGWDGTWLSTNNVSSDQWHHVAVVLDGEAQMQGNVLKAFVDGEQIGAGKGSQLWSHSGSISLGSAATGTRFHSGTHAYSQHRFTGAIDTLSIYNNALNTSEVGILASAF